MKLVGIHVGVAVAAMAFVGGAGAKELTAVKVCGPGSCRDVPHSSLARFGPDPFVGTPVTGTAVAPQPYYLVRFFMGEGGRTRGEAFRGHYALQGQALRETGGRGDEPWTTLASRGAAVLEATLRGLEPFPAPRLARVQVDGHTSADPSAYEPLLGLRPGPIGVLPDAGVPVRLTWNGRSPWSDVTSLEFDPASGLLLGPSGYVRVPRELASRLRREAAGLSPVPTGGGFPWGVATAGAGAASLALGSAALLLARRRRAHPRRAPMPA